MQALVKRDSFGVKLGKLCKFVGDGKAVPVQACFLLNVKANHEIDITAGDGNTYITDTYSLVKVTEPGALCVDAKKLSKLVEKIGGKDEINISLTNNKLVITSGKGQWNLDTMPAETYPEFMPEVSVEEKATVSLDKLQLALACAKVCVAKDMTNPHLTGFRIANDVFTGDVVKMFVFNRDFGGSSLVNAEKGQNGVLISSKCVDALLYDSDTKSADFMRNGNQIVIDGGTFKIVSSMIDGIEKFPSTTPFIEQKLQYKIKMNRQTLVPILDRACIFTVEDLSNAVQIRFTPSEVEVQSFNNKDGGKSSESLPVTYVTTDDFETLVEGNEFTLLVDGQDMMNVLAGLNKDEFELMVEKEAISIKIEQEGLFYFVCTLDFDDGEES
jgi:DNA polymerase-3 subunit beta